MTQKTACWIGESIAALLLAAAILLGAVLAAQGVSGSSWYRQSKIIGSIVSQESFGVSELVSDRRHVDVLLKFVSAVANAYVSFELIPVNEGTTFAAVFESIGPVITVERFDYQRRDLIITGLSPDRSGYYEFLRRLRSKPAFSGVSGHYYITVDDEVRFEIQCTPNHTA